MRDELSICLEEMVNNLADRQFLSKEQKENMYREWAGIGQDNTIIYDNKNRIVGFKPNKPAQVVKFTVMIKPTGEPEVV